MYPYTLFPLIIREKTVYLYTLFPYNKGKNCVPLHYFTTVLVHCFQEEESLLEGYKHYTTLFSVISSLVPRPRPKNRKRGLVALPCIFCRCCKRHQTRAAVGHALQQPLMSADYHSNACKLSKSELNKRCCSRLSSVFIYPVRTNSDRSSQLIGTQASANRPIG